MKIDQKKVTDPEILTLLAGWGTFLRACRIEQRKTHQDAALLCTLSRQTVSRIEKGDPSVSVGQVIRYANALGQAHQFEAPEVGVQAAKRVRKRWSDLLTGSPSGKAATQKINSSQTPAPAVSTPAGKRAKRSPPQALQQGEGATSAD